MQAEVTNKAIEKGNEKPKMSKTAIDPGKVINQLRQEIRNLNKTIKEMRQKPDMQVVNVMMPRKLLSKTNAYLLTCTRSTSENVSLSDLICDAVDVYLWGVEENTRMEEERKKAELQK
jgi:hypothetical protein